MNIIKRICRLSDIKYPWVLLLSMAAFIAVLCMQRYHDIDPSLETGMYGIAFAIALAWGILNYMGHLKLNTLYKKYNDINIFVDAMAMKKEEKAELRQYLNDFVLDLEEQGETYDNAVKKAISHFQVQEFLEAGGGKVLDKPIHWYMLGHSSLFLTLGFIMYILHYVFTIPFIFAALNFTLIVYSIGLLGLFILYKLIDILITNK